MRGVIGSTAFGAARAAYVATAALAVLLSGCLSASALHPSASARPAFEPEVFFAGRTRGAGEVEVRGRDPRGFKVEGFGRTEADGAFRLDQTVTFADGKVETRTWRMRQLGGGAYTATLSDATGEVAAETKGNVFHVRYLMRQPAVYMEQWLYLQPDGRSAINMATVTVAGIPWAQLAEQITRAD